MTSLLWAAALVEAWWQHSSPKQVQVLIVLCVEPRIFFFVAPWLCWRSLYCRNSAVQWIIQLCILFVCVNVLVGFNVLVLEKGGYFRAEEFKSWRESEAFLHAFEKGIVIFIMSLFFVIFISWNRWFNRTGNNQSFLSAKFFFSECSCWFFAGGLCSTVEGNVLVLAGSHFHFFSFFTRDNDWDLFPLYCRFLVGSVEVMNVFQFLPDHFFASSPASSFCRQLCGWW